jgi:uridine phosphorylase
LTLDSEEPKVNGREYHIACGPGDVERYVLLPGDPSRTERISSRWDSIRYKASHREYVTHTGTYAGVGISCTSTGIGGPSLSIALEELFRIGADTFIRVGTSGAIQKEIKLGDLIISSASVRLDGASKQYVRIEYPAAADLEVTMALVEASEELGVRYHVGVTASADTFYTGQGRPGYKGYEQSWMRDILPDLRRARVLNMEMETATLFTVARLYGGRAGAVTAIIAQRETGEFDPDAGIEDAVKVANESVRILKEWDDKKSAAGKRLFFPSLLKSRTG